MQVCSALAVASVPMSQMLNGRTSRLCVLELKAIRLTYSEHARFGVPVVVSINRFS